MCAFTFQTFEADRSPNHCNTVLTEVVLGENPFLSTCNHWSRNMPRVTVVFCLKWNYSKP